MLNLNVLNQEIAYRFAWQFETLYKATHTATSLNFMHSQK